MQNTEQAEHRRQYLYCQNGSIENIQEAQTEERRKEQNKTYRRYET